MVWIANNDMILTLKSHKPKTKSEVSKQNWNQNLSVQMRSLNEISSGGREGFHPPIQNENKRYFSFSRFHTPKGFPFSGMEMNKNAQAL